jgi:drug/metabolite transporter (DMT)-like permease
LRPVLLVSWLNLCLLLSLPQVVVKDVGASFDPFGFAFLRFAVAAAAFAPFTAVAARDKRVLRAGVEIGVWTAAGYITQSAGLLTTDASRASFLSTFTVLVVPFLAGLSGRGVSAVTWASCLAALVGVGLLEQGGAPPGAGDVWSFLSAVAFGVQVFRTEQHARTLGSGASLPLMSVGERLSAMFLFVLFFSFLGRVGRRESSLPGTNFDAPNTGWSPTTFPPAARPFLAGPSTRCRALLLLWPPLRPPPSPPC